MPDWLIKMLADGSNIALALSVGANYAQWKRDDGRQDRLLAAFREGADSTASVAAVMESTENSIGALQRQTALIESVILRCVALLEEHHRDTHK